MDSILTEAQLAQRDASRRLYFVSAGCLYHPRAHLVLDQDATARVALEQSVEAALQFAELSGEEAAAFRKRAVAATRVVRGRDGAYTFKQPERKPRRRRRQRDILRRFASSSPDTIAPPDRRSEARWRAAFLRVVGLLAAASFIVWGLRIAGQALAALDLGAASPIVVGAALVGLMIGGAGAFLLWCLIRPLFD